MNKLFNGEIKMIYRLFFYFIILSMLKLDLSAQEKTTRKEKIETLKIAYLTKELNLNTEEAKAFWPVYDEYQEKLEENRRSFKKQYSVETKSDFSTDKEADAFLQAELTMRSRDLDFHKEYTEKLKKVISSKKVARLKIAEESFKKELLKRAKSKNK